MRRILFLVVVLSLCVSNVAPAAARSIYPAARLPAAPPCDSTAPTSPPALQPDRPSRPNGLPSLSIAPPTNRVQATAAYTYTGSTIVTPTIDGVFTGQFVDGDGITTPYSGTVGVKSPLSFVDEQLFDAADRVYWTDPTYPSLSAFTAWQPQTQTLWLDNNNDGIFQTAPYTDAIIVGKTIVSGTTGFELNGLSSSPLIASGSPYGFSPFVYNDAEYIYPPLSKANNRYDFGEDIYYIGGFFMTGYPPMYIDPISEFRGAQQVLAPDPDNPHGPAIAHLYWTQDANYLYFHNDFLVDSVAPYYDFQGAPFLAGDNGFIDSDGTTTPLSGIAATDRIGIDPAQRQWFTSTDRVAWYDADQNGRWTPSLDALWPDSSNNVYNGGGDAVIVYAGGALTIGITATAILDPAWYDFVYRDDNNSQSWDSGEDIWALTGDEMWDYNYFDNKVTWLIDGDGAATTGRGADDPARVDGDQWFRTTDQVYFYDANGDSEWTDGVDALWKDINGNGTYQSGTDTLIRSDSIVVPVNTSISMTLLATQFVDGDGTASNGAGLQNSLGFDYTPTPFQSSDQVYWHDADNSNDWSSGDSLWKDNAADGVYQTGDSAIISGTAFLSGTTGTLLSSGAHWIGYDDGEVNYNGQYDSGEDIVASNNRFAYDDLEITPNFKYDLGEDIYDRDYIEIWTYAEGNNANTDFDHGGFAPDREPNNRDIGFRVHLNGIRIDNTPSITTTRVSDDYDSPAGIQAAAGWGPSRGFVGPMAGSLIDPAFAGFNRHYEYRLPRHGGTVSGLSAALRSTKPQLPFEDQIIIIFPDCSVKITYIWKDIRQSSPGTYTGPSGRAYGSSAGKATVWAHVDHPSPAVPVSPPVKTDLSDPYYPQDMVVTRAPNATPMPPQSFFDVFVPNNLQVPTEMTRLDLVGTDPLGTLQPVSVQAGDMHTQFNPSTNIGSAFNIPDKGWVEVGVGTTYACCGPTADQPITNTVAATATTGSGTFPVPGSPAGDSHMFSTTITLTLFKTSTPITQVTAGGRLTYTIGYENRSPFPVSGLKISDTLPMSLTDRQAWPVDSFFDVFFEISPTIMLPGDRGQVKISGNISPTIQSGSRITNVVTITFRLPVGFGGLGAIPPGPAGGGLGGLALNTATHSVLVNAANQYWVYLPITLKSYP
jgi:uncharacterized repeat protein (TIGR01451 family)